MIVSTIEEPIKHIKHMRYTGGSENGNAVDQAVASYRLTGLEG